MHEKIFKPISIEIKGNLIKPDNNDGVGINYELFEYSTIIQNILHALKHNHDNDNSTNNIDDNEAQFDNDFQILEDNQIDQMLLQHQWRITMKCNFLNHLDRNQLITEDEFGQEF
ncbi:hypothetical protein F8M41_020151 [Gigaspora margarita]|uniref:Uncharacterized protein n=1 Tax=Gigaspora margarita TaxID=4874 RepID=A0A8H4AIS2_GIGMA|nr:hypothetical protein F8M41_020151 [Gigaspora margarita]